MLIKQTIIFTLMFVPSLSNANDWNYKYQEQWGDIKGSEICKVGNQQSPVNFDSRGTENKQNGLNVISHYQNDHGELLETGQTVQYISGEGNRLVVNGLQYQLLQFHLHSPSEHKVDGKSFPLELHLVHKNQNGELAVLGLLFQEGEENKALQDFFSAISLENYSHKKIDVSLNKLVPINFAGFHYLGSLTTPPCTEGVKWFVQEKPLQLSAKQLEAFKKLHSDTAREIQLNQNKVVKLHAD